MFSEQCPCGSGKTYSDCCEPFILKRQNPKTPEQLMRSRYTAYTQVNIDYIADTMCGPAAVNFDPNASKQWAEDAKWVGLSIVNVSDVKDNKGYVEFIARYKQRGKMDAIHENSEFHFIEGRWFYVNGQHGKLNRNSPCPCGSGKKYKRCCLT